MMPKRPHKQLTASPCVGICSTSLGDAICFGCGRTFEEVHQWNELSDTQKDIINRRLINQKKHSIAEQDTT